MTDRVRDHRAEIAQRPPTIGAALAVAAQRWPDAEALVDRTRRWTFRRYRESADDVARGLIAHRVGAGDRVAIWAPNSADVAIVALAVYSIGATVVPLNTRLTLRADVATSGAGHAKRGDGLR